MALLRTRRETVWLSHPSRGQCQCFPHHFSFCSTLSHFYPRVMFHSRSLKFSVLWVLWKKALCSIKMSHWMNKQHPSSVFSPGKSHGERSLVGYSPWGRKELDVTEEMDCKMSQRPKAKESREAKTPSPSISREKPGLKQRSCLQFHLKLW